MSSLQVLMCSVLAVGVMAPVLAHAQTRVEEGASTAINFINSAATVTYTGKWHQTEIMRNWSGGTAAASIWGPANSASPSDANVPAARVTLSFSGTRVKWIGARGPQTGIAQVFVDGVPVGTVDTYVDVPAGDEQIQAVLFTSEVLPAGSHTLAIEVTGTKNPASSGFVIVVDAFDIEGTPSGRLQETGTAAVTYYGTWIQGDATRPGVSGGTFAYSYAELDPGIVPAQCVPPQTCEGVTTRAVLTFSGTRVSWIGARAPGTGIAKVYVDGVFVEQVDTVSPDPQEHLQEVLFTSGVLEAGIHTLAIEVMGTLDRPYIVVDAFDVTP